MHPADIAILTDEKADDPPEIGKYLIHPLSEGWKAMGLRVTLLRGAQHFEPARLLIPHIDATVRPVKYDAFLRRYRRVVNRRLADVSRSGYSENLVGPDSGYAGPVIVKTNRNYGGLPELHAATVSGRRSLAERLRSRWAAFFGASPSGVAWKRVEWLDTASYPVFEKLRDVPRGVFRNPNLVVEKFNPEIEGGHYCIRYAYVLGPREITLRFKSRRAVVKAADAKTCEEVETPPEIGAWRRRLGLDYGKIDFVVAGGKPVLLDVNPTPAMAALKRHNLVRRVAQALRDGVEEFLR
jgi:hypothetical protein